jgi:SAM-dependent methyltransferase
MTGEENRIREVYRRRHSDPFVYSLFNPGQLFMTQSLERQIIRALYRHGFYPLHSHKILEVGCGTGWALRQLISLGANPENLCGVDLLEHAIEEARKINPNVDLRHANGEELPFSTGIFDIVIQFTVFTSILDQGMKQRIAREMLRVLKNSGVILWYDYFISKPTNRDVKGIGRREVMALFPGCEFEFKKVTLAPPIARILAPRSFLLCYMLCLIPWLRTHYLAVMRTTPSR